MKKYTLGLIFNSRVNKVVLMEKNRPDWQKGKLNAVGGGIDGEESNIECMVREAQEETNLLTKPQDWKHVAVLSGPDWKMDVFGLIYQGREEDLQTCTDERVDWFEITKIPKHVVTNVPWLLYLSLEKLQNNKLDVVTISYR